MRMGVVAAISAAVCLGACGASRLAGQRQGGASDAGPADAPAAFASEEGGGGSSGAPGARDGAAYDPFAPQPDPGGGLTDVSADLAAVLENGALTPGACAAVDAGTADLHATLLCGKYMFFYDPLGTSGIPTALVQFMASSFPDALGLGFSKLGLVPDPASTQHMPLGMASTVPLNGDIDAVAFTCASCHFAQLPDGRYAVGAPNHAYDYARHVLDLSLAPVLAAGLGQASQHDPGAVAMVQPVLDAVAATPSLKSQLVTALLPLASVHAPTMTTDEEHDYTAWPSGTMDFLIAPLPVDDHVHVVSKIQPLWGIPSPQEVKAAGMPSALLASTGDVPDLPTFVWSFGVVGQATTPPTAARMAPLVAYVLSLRAPANPQPPDPSLVAQGEALFASKGCAACHDGPRGSGRRPYTFAEIGTDSTLAQWADPDGGPVACCGVPTAPGGLTHGLKSPRLVGMWAMRRFLHNGALSSLDQLFCRYGDAGPPPVGTAPMQTVGHAFTCDGLTDTDKQALLAYVEAH